MTDTATAGTDESAGTSTGTQGDTSTDSPAVIEAPAKSQRELITERTKALKAPKAKADGERPAGEQQRAEPVAEAGDADPQGDKSQDKGKEEQKPIPFKAFQERLGREAKKASALRDQLASKELESTKTRAALNIAAAEVERLQALLRGGGKYDERDEEVQGFRLTEQARAERARLESEHEGARAKQAEDEKVSAMRERISEEIDTALSGADLIHRRELIEAMRRQENHSRSAKEVADSLQAIKLEKAKPRLVQQRPSTPSTVREQRGGGSSSVSYSNDRSGIRDRVKSLRNQQG
jgi:hypothetical protein